MSSHKLRLRAFGSGAFLVQSEPIRVQNLACFTKTQRRSALSDQEEAGYAGPVTVFKVKNLTNTFHSLLPSANLKIISYTMYIMPSKFPVL